MGSSFMNAPQSIYMYRIKPRPPAVITNEEYSTIEESTGMMSDLVCFCTTAGGVACYGGDGPCPPGGCEGCKINNGNIDIFKNHLTTPSPSMCNLRIEDETPYPNPPIASHRLLSFPNTNTPAPENYGYFSYYDGEESPGYRK